MPITATVIMQNRHFLRFKYVLSHNLYWRDLRFINFSNNPGKTTVTERGLAHEWFAGCEYIRPDLIARDEFGDWNSPDAIRNAANRACAEQKARKRKEKSMSTE